MQVQRFRERPKEIEAILWEGKMTDALRSFLGGTITDQPPPEQRKHLFWNDQLRVWDPVSKRHLVVRNGYYIVRDGLALTLLSPAAIAADYEVVAADHEEL